jgi:hypothetical protein
LDSILAGRAVGVLGTVEALVKTFLDTDEHR